MSPPRRAASNMLTQQRCAALRCVSCAASAASVQPAAVTLPARQRLRPAPPPEAAAEPPSRTVCRRCDRALCLCSFLPDDGGAETKTSFLIVQSRKERFNALSTGRLAALGLRRCSLVWDTDADERLPRPASLPPDAGLLYPGEGATMLSASARSAPSTLIVVDATWSEAGRWLKKNEWLATLPRFALAPAPEERSNYRIRKQPAPECLSTVECVVRVLQAVEPGAACDAAADRLLTAFDALVDKQLEKLATAPRGLRRHIKRPRTSPRQALTKRGLDEPGATAVIAYGEYYCERLVHWAALRPATGDVFQSYVDVCDEDVRAQLAAVLAANKDSDELWISREAATAAAQATGACASPAAFDAAWAAWLRPGERIAMWSARHAALSHPLGLSVQDVPGAPAGAYSAPPLALKEAYAALLVARQRGKPTKGPRTLGDAVEAETGAQDAAVVALPALRGRVEGRAALALAHTVGMARRLAALATAEEEES